MSDTIYAIASGLGTSAIAVVRVSGSRAIDAVKELCGKHLQPRIATLGSFRDPVSGALIDRGLAIWFPAPASFTGEDCLEFHIHGGRAVKMAMLRALARLSGFRIAEPGEFARRAFLNGKLDLTEAEGLADLLEADTDDQLQQALALSGGELKVRVDRWRSAIVHVLSIVSALIDFSDEDDVSTPERLPFIDLLREIKREMECVVGGASRGLIIKEGFRVAICGLPNAGKSSLINFLARRDVAIVSPIAGTTRDPIEVRLDLRGIPIVLIDTAGIRDDASDVEIEAIKRSHAFAETADLAIWLYDVREPGSRFPVVSSENILLVANKIDACSNRDDSVLGVSAISGQGIDGFLDEVYCRAEHAFGLRTSSIVSRERHKRALLDAAESLESAIDCVESVDIVADSLWRAARSLDRLVGKIDVEEILGAIFSQFCIGK